MTYLGASAAALATDRNTWHTRADQAYGTSRVWSSGSSFETDLTNMTNDRNYWKTTVAHDDPNVWTNRYNAGVSAANAALPAPYELTTPTVNNNSWTTSETTLRTLTANRTGYWWASASVIVADGGTVANCTVRIRMNNTVVATVTFFNASGGTRGSGLVAPSAPVLISNGQTITFTAQHESGSGATQQSTLLIAGFVPSPGYPA